MNTKFHISRLKSKLYTFIVYSLDSSRIEEYLCDVAKILEEKSYTGEVLFDLLLSNGTHDRFYVIYFNGTHFDLKSIKHISSIPENFIYSVNSYYQKNKFLLSKGVLNPAQRFLFTLDKKPNISSAF